MELLPNPFGTYTLFRRETRRFLKVYLQTVLSPVVSNLLYLTIFGISLHRSIPNIDGITYLQFLAPGLIIMGIINNAFQNPSSSLIISKYQNLIPDLLIIPLKRIEIFTAYIAAATLRGLMVGAITLITLIFFVDLPFASVIIIIISCLLTSLFFSFLGMLTGLWAREFDHVALIQNFVLTPLSFLGGVFYPINALPETARAISSLNPIVYMLDLIRYGFTGVHQMNIVLSISIVTTITFIIGLATYLLLRSGWRLQT